MKHFYFIRHGQSVANKSGTFSGRTDTPLNPAGRAQAEEAGQQLRSLAIDHIVSSPLGRAKETAELIAGIVGFPKDKIIFSDLFTERDFGPLEGTTYLPHLGDRDGVESVAKLLERAKSGVSFLDSLDGQTILIVSHGAIGRALRHCLNPNIPYQHSQGFENGQIVKLL